MKNTISRHRICTYIFALLAGIFLLAFTNVNSYAKTDQSGWLGVGIKELTPSMQKKLNMEQLSGILITDVKTDSPAEDAGLQENDVVLEYAGKSVKYLDEFVEMVRKTEPDTEVLLTIWRDGETITKEITIGSKEDFVGKIKFPKEKIMLVHEDSPWIGIRIQDLNQDLAEYFKVAANEGVLVTEVVAASPAAKAGLKAGDIVTTIDDYEIPDTKTILSVLKDYEDGDEIAVRIVRKGKTKNFNVRLESREISDMKIIKKRIIKDAAGDCQDIDIDIDIDVDEILDNVDRALEHIFEDIGI